VLEFRRVLFRSPTVACVPEKRSGLSASELRPLLDELVDEGRIFRGVLLRTYTIWNRAPGTSIRERGSIPIGGDLDVVRRRDPMWRLRRSDARLGTLRTEAARPQQSSDVIRIRCR